MRGKYDLILHSLADDDRECGQEHVLLYELRVADAGSWLKRTLRSIWIKVPVVFHVARNWKQAKSYL